MEENTKVVWKIHKNEEDIYVDYLNGKITVINEAGAKTMDITASTLSLQVLWLLMKKPNSKVSHRTINDEIWAHRNRRLQPSGLAHSISVQMGTLYANCENIKTCIIGRDGTYMLECISTEIVDQVPLMYNEEKITYYNALYRRLKQYANPDDAQINQREKWELYLIPKFTNGVIPKFTKGVAEVSHPFEEENFRIFIQADSGYGKSTLLELLPLLNVLPTLKEANTEIRDNEERLNKYHEIRKAFFGKNEKEYFPVFIKAFDSGSAIEGDTPEQKLEKLINCAVGSKTPGFWRMLEEAHEDGKLLFIVDGIDEIPDRDKAMKYQELIECLAEKYEKTSVVASSRFFGNTMLQKFNKIGIRDFDLESEKPLISSILDADQADKLIEIIEGNDYYLELIKNPNLVIKLLGCRAAGFSLDKVLSFSRNKIVNERMVNIMQGDIRTQRINHCLGGLALHFVFSNISTADFDRIQALLNKVNEEDGSEPLKKEDVDNFARQLASHSGIINLYVNDDAVEVYAFQDRLIKIELGAEHLLKRMQLDQYAPARTDADIRKAVQALEELLDEYRIDKDAILSKEMVEMIALMCVKAVPQARIISPGIFASYLAVRDATSSDENERLNIQNGYDILLNNKFGAAMDPNRRIEEILSRMKNN